MIHCFAKQRLHFLAKFYACQRLCLLLVVIPSVVFAQVPANHSTQQYENVSQFLTRLSPNEGLSQSYVNKTVQDNQGFIWIATEMGLNRYDGYQVQHINGPNNVFSEASIRTLFIDSQGYLWVSTLYSGLYRLDTTSLVVTQFFTGKLADQPTQVASVDTIIEGDNHQLWLGISGKLFLFNPQTKKLTHYFTVAKPNDIIRALLIKQNWLFCATSNGLYRLNLTTHQMALINHRPNSIKTSESNNTKFLLTDAKLGLLVGTVDGLYALTNYLADDPNKITNRLIIKSLNIWHITRYVNKYLLATNLGLFQFDPSNLQSKFILKFSASHYQVTDDNILDILPDRSGNFWLASRSQGVMIWSPLTERFTNISASTKLKLSHDDVWATYQDQQKAIWVGTDNGLNKISLTNQSVQHYLVSNDTKAVSGNQLISSIFQDKNDTNSLWLATSLGLKHFNKTTGELQPADFDKTTAAMLVQHPSYNYHVVNNQQILFFNDLGYFSYNLTTHTLTTFSALAKMAPPSLAQAFIGQIGAHKNDMLLTTSGHLFRLNLVTQKITQLYKSPNYHPQNYNYIDSWLLDNNNILWLAIVGEGLVGIDYKTLTERYRFNTHNGLTSNSIYGLQQDNYHNLWFSSQAGIYRFNLKNHHIEHFTAKDGLLSNEYNSFAFTKLQDNRLVYGSTRGITLINPSDFITSPSRKPYQVHLTNVKIFTDTKIIEQLQQTKQINLAHNDYGLKLHFSTLQFNQQQKTLYNIVLNGPTQLHFQRLAKNELLLSKLPAGHYQLQITAINPITGQLSTPLTLTINAKNVFWLSTSAKFGYAILLFFLIANFIDRRNSQRRHLESEHEKAQTSSAQIQLALEASGSSIWDYYQFNQQLYRTKIDNGIYNEQDSLVSLTSHFKAIDPLQQANIEQQWLDFISGKQKRWDVNYRVAMDDGSWQWYRDKGSVIKYDDHGVPVRFSGTYTNITEQKAKEAQMAIFGEAFSQINDWVLILDANKKPITANKAFMTTFAAEQESPLSSLQRFFQLVGKQKTQEFTEILDNLKVGEIWQSEELISTNNNERHPILVKINVIEDENNQITHYVAVISDISAQKEAEEKLRHWAHYDYLTNLPNRRLILEKIDHTIAEYPHNEKKSALFFIDLDKFKQVNDSLGHQAGDELLKYVADTLLDNVKSRDIVARQSGDEFMILIEQFARIDDLMQLAQRINHRLSKPVKIASNNINVSSSIGIAIFPDDADNSAELIRKADLAMIHAKQLGRSQFQFFTPEMNAKAHRRLELEIALVHAHENQQFQNFYQPIIDCDNQQIIGFEMLLRWSNNGTMISPMEFIPIAEEIGMIAQLTDAAVDRALRDYHQLQALFPSCYISINLSAIHVLQPGLCATLLKLISKHKLSSKVLRLEITEGTLLVDKKTTQLRLQELKSHGFKLLLDDFGTGYSSLTYLSQFPIDVLKIDQSFVRNLQSNPMNKAIVKTIVALADSLSLDCITEGIEDIEQLNYIRNLGCSQIQGYYFAKPAPLAELLAPQFQTTIEQKFAEIR